MLVVEQIGMIPNEHIGLQKDVKVILHNAVILKHQVLVHLQIVFCEFLNQEVFGIQDGVDKRKSPLSVVEFRDFHLVQIRLEDLNEK